MPWRCSTLLLCSVGPLERIFIALLAVLCWPSRMHIYCSVGPPEHIFIALLAVLCWPSRMHIYCSVGLLECNIMVLLVLTNEDTPGHLCPGCVVHHYSFQLAQFVKTIIRLNLMKLYALSNFWLHRLEHVFFVEIYGFIYEL